MNNFRMNKLTSLFDEVTNLDLLSIKVGTK